MEICVLGSGSSGNCIYVASGETQLLLDAGLGYKETIAQLAQINVKIDSITAVLFTHGHADHCRSAGAIHRRHSLPVYANEATASVIQRISRNPDITWNIFETGSQFEVGDLLVESFPVSHDAAESVGFVISDKRVRLGVAIDLGMATQWVRQKLSGCHALILEANHDVEMLQQSGRPRRMIQRILGRQGHLSNKESADLLADVLWPQLELVFLAHLSTDCNTPALAECAMREVLWRAGRDDIQLVTAREGIISARIQI